MLRTDKKKEEIHANAKISFDHYELPPLSWTLRKGRQFSEQGLFFHSSTGLLSLSSFCG